MPKDIFRIGQEEEVTEHEFEYPQYKSVGEAIRKLGEERVLDFINAQQKQITRATAYMALKTKRKHNGR